MKINGVGSNYNYATYNANKQTKASGGFSDALSDAVANSKESDVSERMANLELIARFGAKRLLVNINNMGPPITANTENLTGEQRGMLNERHDIGNIRYGSHEHNALMLDLVKMGVISDIPHYMPSPSDIISITICDDGYIRGVLARGHNEQRNLMDWLESSLRMWEGQYRSLRTKENLSGEDKILLHLHTAQRAIFEALKDVFAEQLDG